MAIESINWGSSDEKRIGVAAVNGLPRIDPLLDIFGQPAHKPYNRYYVPGRDNHFIVLPPRPLKADEWQQVYEAVGLNGDGTPNGSEGVPMSDEEAAKTPDAEYTTTYPEGGFNSDQSKEFIGTPPAPPTAQPPVGFVGDGVPVNDGSPIPATPDQINGQDIANLKAPRQSKFK